MLALGLFKNHPVPGCYKLYPDMATARLAQTRYSDSGVMSRAVMETPTIIHLPSKRIFEDVGRSLYMTRQIYVFVAAKMASRPR